MSPDFDIRKLLEVVGPTASLLFAAWIFLQYLNQRFVASLQRLRELAENLRQSQGDDRRIGSVRDQIRLYRRRCILMRQATNVGLGAALALLASLTLAAVVTVFHGPPALDIAGALCVIVGLLLVMVATVSVLFENRLVAVAHRSELTDLDH